MSQQASVAPKERVNIVYRPAEGDGREEVELPMKLLVLGDFSGGSEGRPLEEREPVSVNKDNFDEVMKGHGVSLAMEVPNRLTGSEDPLQLRLSFQKLADFRPEAVVEQLPELKAILELREALRSLKGPLANLPEFRRKIQEMVGNASTRAKLLTEIGITDGRDRDNER
ncbi:type VI secretion system contractile sheath small subunit [Geomonas sp.]|uniref:type VI secretion system contractile sheath small subunit n=1 Tax=Geomonas sp. TaxID=2651584 RepID=UPI002B48844A|nr:type VI secretion system contractile sheath small subunit [Geomonas sp.]HJV35410.1 type VI secretion system contractile sheath small subunit [Geomonas sp.]